MKSSNLADTGGGGGGSGDGEIPGDDFMAGDKNPSGGRESYLNSRLQKALQVINLTHLSPPPAGGDDDDGDRLCGGDVADVGGDLLPDQPLGDNRGRIGPNRLEVDPHVGPLRVHFRVRVYVEFYCKEVGRVPYVLVDPEVLAKGGTRDLGPHRGDEEGEAFRGRGGARVWSDEEFHGGCEVGVRPPGHVAECERHGVHGPADVVQDGFAVRSGGGELEVGRVRTDVGVALVG